ncbi:MAG: hypothetical protein ACOZNI_36605 [Myxococcota bacterium]
MVQTLAIVWWVAAGLQLLLALCFGLLFSGMGMIPLLAGGSDPDAPIVGGIFVVMGVAFGFFIAVMSLPSFAAAWGLQKRRQWGRILAMVLGALQLFSFPLGTALGVYTLVVLLKPEVQREFA